MLKNITASITFCLLACMACNTHIRADGIPYPKALELAEIKQTQITDIKTQALVLGNGDLNALLWEQNSSLRMRVTKNDIWDARIDTSKDPALLQMDIKKRTWKGGTGTVPSWSNHPYPQPRCAAEILIGSPDSKSAVAPAWSCVRNAQKNNWTTQNEIGVMSVQGSPGTSAGYGCNLNSVKTDTNGSIELELAGSANARYYVDVSVLGKTSAVKSGWIDAPTTKQKVSFPLPDNQTITRLDLYVWSTDGKPAQIRYSKIAFNLSNDNPKEIELTNLDVSSWNAHLDLRKALATLDKKNKKHTTVRILAERNVVLIDGPDEVSLKEIKAPQLPPAKLGTTDNVKWLHMKMPGDVDYTGMEYALAIAAKGNRKAVSLVTSFDTEEPVLKAAIALAQRTIETSSKELIETHENAWAKFWSASGLQLGDRFFQNAWYRNMYYMRCFCRPGTTMPITLYAGLVNDGPGWHGAPTLDYNIEQEFWPMFSCNQMDLMEPYVRYIKAFAPRARWLAKQTYGLEGLFLPVNIFGPEHLVHPENAKSNNSRQIAYVPWTYGMGLTGWGLQNLWLCYKYQPDLDYLQSVYPLLRDGAQFYANVVEQCKDDSNDGKVEIGPSYNPEHGPFGSLNNPVDIAYFNFLLKSASEAATILNRDKQLVDRWQKTLSLLPDYETASLNGKPIVANWKGAKANAVPVHNVASPTVPIFPAEQITFFSPPEEKELFQRTLRWIKHNGNNSHIMVNVAKARFSMPEAYQETRDHFSKILTPNGLYASWPGHGYYLAESWAFAGLTAELLMQSVNDIIRIFPAWPKEHDARFTDLRAQGGFLVSAQQKDGYVTSLVIKSTANQKLRLLSPWKTPVKVNGKIIKQDKQGIIELPAKPDQTFVFTTSD